jgi:DNA-binding response OmpR family regulator
MNISKSSEKIKILLVEDDINLGFLLVDFLESNGYEVKLYRDGEMGLKGFMANGFDFCILDLMLPKKDGFTLLQEIKGIKKDIPVIILSARSLKDDKIKGFRLGIDDYITKPFDEEELLYRIKAILSRASLGSMEEPITLLEVGQYQFDLTTRMLKLGEKSQRLTHKECQILEILVKSARKTVKREEIMIAVWGESGYFTGRSLDVFISKLRSYLKDDPSIQITTIPTVGYIMEVRASKKSE